MSYRSEPDQAPRAALLARVAALATAEGRTAAARDVATLLGADDLLIFIRDAEIDALLPAPGFPPTLRDAREWRRLTGDCLRDGRATRTLPLHAGGEATVRGVRGADGSVLALIGGEPDDALVSDVVSLLPLLASAFRGERALATAAAQTRLAAVSAEQSQRLVVSLDEARAAVQQALNKAKAANLAKDRFLAVLSHELRTPLSPVLLAANLLEADFRLPADLLPEVQAIKRNAQLEARLIDDLLDVTRITHGKLELHRAPTDAARLLEHTLEMYRSEVAEKRIVLRVEQGAGATSVLADSARLQQVFWNLVKNAVKFTPAGGSILVRTYDAAGGGFAVDLTDTGIGMDATTVARVFEAFEQGGSEVTREFGGLGLGLSISKALVELHDGTIRASSPGRGRGATFTVELPAQPLATAAAAATVPPADGRAPAGGTGPRALRLLLVEDHPDTAQMMTMLLESFGHSVRAAGTIHAAQALAASTPFDLLISDVGLPDGTGMDLMRSLRLTGDLKGIALTGYGMEEDIRRCREAGFVHHLTKPVDADRLEAALQQFC